MRSPYNAVRDLLGLRLKSLAKREQGMTSVGYTIMLFLLAVGAAHSDPDTWKIVTAFFDTIVRATDDLLYKLQALF